MASGSGISGETGTDLGGGGSGANDAAGSQNNNPATVSESGGGSSGGQSSIQQSPSSGSSPSPASASSSAAGSSSNSSDVITIEAETDGASGGTGSGISGETGTDLGSSGISGETGTDLGSLGISGETGTDLGSVGSSDSSSASSPPSTGGTGQELQSAATGTGDSSSGGQEVGTTGTIASENATEDPSGQSGAGEEAAGGGPGPGPGPENNNEPPLPPPTGQGGAGTTTGSSVTSATALSGADLFGNDSGSSVADATQEGQGASAGPGAAAAQPGTGGPGSSSSMANSSGTYSLNQLISGAFGSNSTDPIQPFRTVGPGAGGTPAGIADSGSDSGSGSSSSPPSAFGTSEVGQTVSSSADGDSGDAAIGAETGTDLGAQGVSAGTESSIGTEGANGGASEEAVGVPNGAGIGGPAEESQGGASAGEGGSGPAEEGQAAGSSGEVGSGPAEEGQGGASAGEGGSGPAEEGQAAGSSGEVGSGPAEEGQGGASAGEGGSGPAEEGQAAGSSGEVGSGPAEEEESPVGASAVAAVGEEDGETPVGATAGGEEAAFDADETGAGARVNKGEEEEDNVAGSGSGAAEQVTGQEAEENVGGGGTGGPGVGEGVEGGGSAAPAIQSTENRDEAPTAAEPETNESNAASPNENAEPEVPVPDLAGTVSTFQQRDSGETVSKEAATAEAGVLTSDSDKLAAIIQNVKDTHGVDIEIGVRTSEPLSAQLDVSPKLELIKGKAVSALDMTMGAPPEAAGTATVYEPLKLSADELATREQAQPGYTDAYNARYKSQLGLFNDWNDPKSGIRVLVDSTSKVDDQGNLMYPNGVTAIPSRPAPLGTYLMPSNLKYVEQLDDPAFRATAGISGEYVQEGISEEYAQGLKAQILDTYPDLKQVQISAVERGNGAVSFHDDLNGKFYGSDLDVQSVRPANGADWPAGKRGQIETLVNAQLGQLDRFPGHGWSDAGTDLPQNYFAAGGKFIMSESDPAQAHETAAILQDRYQRTATNLTLQAALLTNRAEAESDPSTQKMALEQAASYNNTAAKYANMTPEKILEDGSGSKILVYSADGIKVGYSPPLKAPPGSGPPPTVHGVPLGRTGPVY
jgi:hypothetical protein